MPDFALNARGLPGTIVFTNLANAATAGELVSRLMDRGNQLVTCHEQHEVDVQIVVSWSLLASAVVVPVSEEWPAGVVSVIDGDSLLARLRKVTPGEAP